MSDDIDQYNRIIARTEELQRKKDEKKKR